MAKEDNKRMLEKQKKIVFIDECEFSENINDILNNYGIERQYQDRIIELYYLYEFTDDILVINNTSLYPSMFNYIKTGLLTEEEMIQALLHE